MSVVSGGVGSLCSHDGRGGGVTEGCSAPLPVHSGETSGLNYKISAENTSLSEASDLECKDQAKTEFNNVGFILRVSHNRTLSAKI